MSYEISMEASADMENIWLYTLEHWSLEQADRYLNLIFDEIEYIAKHPESGRDYGYVRKGYRCSKIKSHLIFYRIIEEAIKIIRVLHERMDIEERLNG